MEEEHENCEGEGSSLMALAAAAQAKLETLKYQRELRGLELKAYAGVLEALRASGKPNPEKDVLMKTLREYFDISEDRHKSEIRLLAYDNKLGLISQKLNGYDYSDDWAFLAQRVYVPLGPQPFSLYRSCPSNVIKSSVTIKDPIPSGRLKDSGIVDDDSDLDSDSELEWIENIIKESSSIGVQPEKPKPYTLVVEPGEGNEEEIEELEALMKKKLKNQVKKQQQQYTPPKSPDITDAPRTPTKGNSSRNSNEDVQTSNSKSRPVKRKTDSDASSKQKNQDSSLVNVSKRLTEKAKNIKKIKKPSRPPPKVKIAPRREPIKKEKESSEETSSADEGENCPYLPHNEENSRVMSPVFSEVIRTSVFAKGGRAKGGSRAKGSTDRRRNNVNTSPAPAKSKGGKSQPRTPNQKAAKHKNSTPTSGSRRKSKLNKKIDYDDFPIGMDRGDLERQWPPSPQYHNSVDEIQKRIYYDNQMQLYDRLAEARPPIREFKQEEYSLYSTEPLPPNYNHADLEQVTDGVFKRPLPPSKGPKPWEIKDARLNHVYHNEMVSDENVSSGNVLRGENEDIIIGSTTSDLSSQNLVNCVNDASYVPSTPPKNCEQPKKQRIKSPLIVNPSINPPNASKVLSTPVFSTSLSKKRQNNKPISVVDSLNLHLPTSATASSLAASSNNRRPGTASGGGCSMFSNSSALIAGARGTAPGILQQQRKAQPHILSNSKVQRTFLPSVVNTTSVSNSNNISVSNNNSPVNSAAAPVAALATSSSSVVVPTNSVAASAQSVQISAAPIPISVTPSNSLPFPNFPTSSPSSINLASTAVPISHVNRPSANIIFVQKANGPAVGVAGGAAVPSNVIPIKTPPRAVILRRAQVPRQGNVMILDMQKNPLVGTGQPSPIIQTSRVINAPGELSLISMQPSSPPKKSTSPLINPNQMSPSNSFSMSPSQIQDNDSIVVGTSGQIQESIVAISQAVSDSNQIVHFSNSQIQSDHQQAGQAVLDGNMIVMIPASTSDQGAGQDVAQQDVQYAQIEAELMQMEQGGFEEVVYEEEVMTEVVPMEESDSTQYIYTTDAVPTSEGEILLTTQPSETPHNASATSGSSTDTASETDTSLQQTFESPENDGNRPTSVTKVTLSPTGEVKIASEAISRALSLSKSSPAKKLTFSAPISFATATSLAGNFTIAASKASTGPEASTNTTPSTQINIVPTSLQTATTTIKSGIILDGDSLSTNPLHLGKPEMVLNLNLNEIQLQENSKTS